MITARSSVFPSRLQFFFPHPVILLLFIRDFSVAEHSAQRRPPTSVLSRKATATEADAGPSRGDDAVPAPEEFQITEIPEQDLSVDPLAEFYEQAKKDSEEGRNVCFPAHSFRAVRHNKC